MANHKPPRADSEVQTLAARWRTEWAPNDGIDPWLRRHLAELTRLLRNDRWSWFDLARALNDAGIIHATGRPWSAAHLGSKVRTLRTRQRRTSTTRSTPQDLAATIRDVLAATEGGFANVTINLPSAVAPVPAHATRPSPQRAAASPLNIETTASPQDDAAEMQEEPGFTFARLKGWSPPPASAPAAADQPSPVAKGGSRNAEQVLREFLSRPRRGSIPMPPIPEPEDE